MKNKGVIRMGNEVKYVLNITIESFLNEVMEVGAHCWTWEERGEHNLDHLAACTCTYVGHIEIPRRQVARGYWNHRSNKYNLDGTENWHKIIVRLEPNLPFSQHNFLSCQTRPIQSHRHAKHTDMDRATLCWYTIFLLIFFDMLNMKIWSGERKGD